MEASGLGVFHGHGVLTDLKESGEGGGSRVTQARVLVVFEASECRRTGDRCQKDQTLQYWVRRVIESGGA